MRIEEVIGTRIAAVRQSKGLSQTALGQHLAGVLDRAWTPQQVSNAEKGKRAFTAAELIAFAFTLEVPIVELLTPPVSVEHIELPNGGSMSTRQLHPTPGAASAVLESLRQLEKDRAHRARLDKREQTVLSRLMALLDDGSSGEHQVDDDNEDNA